MIGSPRLLFRLIASDGEIRANEDPNHQDHQTNAVTGEVSNEDKGIRQIRQEREAEEQKRDADNVATCFWELHKDSIECYAMPRSILDWLYRQHYNHNHRYDNAQVYQSVKHDVQHGGKIRDSAPCTPVHKCRWSRRFRLLSRDI